MPVIPDLTLSHNRRPQAGQLLEALCDVYADAYGVEADGEKVPAFRVRAGRQLGRPGFELATAAVGAELVGFAFGATLSADTHWWDGLEPEPEAGFCTETGARTFVLSEIEVRRSWQGEGVGRALHDSLLSSRGEERATLATSPDAPVQALYAGWGWQQVGRVPGADGEYFSAYDLFVLSLPIASR
jgi:GNAT superfamily N-acetyltransferase